ncbi:MAG: hypothetical protein JST51_02725 [Armatimonadetes bacterium]|nr:hypothetical protein [Armatimonadota bacterium]
MPHQHIEQPVNGAEVLRGLREFITLAAASYGTTEAIRPPHRIKFHWPPHPVSYEYHVLNSDWTGTASFVAHGEMFHVEVAKTNFGVFGRCSELWNEAKADTEEEMLTKLRDSSEPILQRQLSISRSIGHPSRYKGEIRDLPPVDILKLFYCEDRDVANSAHETIEVSKFRNAYFPSLCHILRDRTHPWRRSAQWCVLDLFEDLPSFIASEKDEIDAVEAMKSLLMDAEDDYARTVYKAGVVLGGHLPHRRGGNALLECLTSPSIIGRRSAIHGLFHVCEWVPEMTDEVVHTLRENGKQEQDPQLAIFSFAIAEDILRGTIDHTPEPVFAFER